MAESDQRDPKYYCRRCGTVYYQEGSCDWCPDIELAPLVAEPARDISDSPEVES